MLLFAISGCNPVAADQQIMALMQQLKRNEPEAFGWLIPYEGDWHILLNASQLLADQGWEAGLSVVADALGLGHCMHSSKAPL